MPEYPNWPERWEYFDGILKYTPHEAEEIGGEWDVAGIPLDGAVWIVGGVDPEPPKRKKKKRKKKRGTKKRKKNRGHKERLV